MSPSQNNHSQTVYTTQIGGLVAWNGRSYVFVREPSTNVGLRVGDQLPPNLGIVLTANCGSAYCSE